MRMRPDGLRRLNGVLVWPAKPTIRAGASPARTNPNPAQASDSASSLAPLCTLTLTGLGGGEVEGHAIRSLARRGEASAPLIQFDAVNRKKGSGPLSDQEPCGFGQYPFRSSVPTGAASNPSRRTSAP